MYAPRIYTVNVPTDKIREIIGPGGKVIRGIIDATGVKIDVHDDGTVNIFASDGDSAKPPSRWSPTSPPWPRSARPTWARSSASRSSAPSSRSSPAPTACCTSARSARIA
ncbi:MAG: KH domain-containing protein [Paludibaculum sp.]